MEDTWEMCGTGKTRSSLFGYWVRHPDVEAIARRIASGVSLGIVRRRQPRAAPAMALWVVREGLRVAGLLRAIPSLTKACRRPPIASAPASLQLSAAPEAAVERTAPHGGRSWDA